jgi:Mg/Co/Ni transporter MgtE
MDEDENKSLLLKVSQKSLKTLHPADIAEILVDLGLEERLNLFNSLDIETASDTLKNLPIKNAIQILESIDIKRASKLIEEIEIDRAVDLIIHSHSDKRNMILKKISKVKAKQIRELSKHSEKIAGSIMNTEFIHLKPDFKISQALKIVMKKIIDIDAIHHIYVVDDENKLVGIVSLRELLIVKSNALVKDIMNKKIINVNIDTNIDEVAYTFLKYGLSLIPVIDEKEKIIGVISMLDALRQAYPELKEDIEGI